MSNAHDENYVTAMAHTGQAMLRQGRWKLTAIEAPFDESKFALYDLATDPGETTDLSESDPERRAALIEIWRRERIELGIVLPEDL